MQSLWSDADANRFTDDYRARGVSEDLAIRTYTSRLLGGVPSLVMHGGGNTSVKTRLSDLFGDQVDVLCVKGSGRDLATIEPDGHPAVRLAPLFRLRSLAQLSDEDMVNVQRQNLLDTSAPNPSVETLLHAYLPHKFVDHTHAVISTAIACLPDARSVCERVFGGRVAYVPYIMPGFALAKEAAAAFEAAPHVQGLLLGKHGIFSFAEHARTSYELMIEFVTLAERFVAERGHPSLSLKPASLPVRTAQPADVLPALRKVLGHASSADGIAPHWLLDLRTDERSRRFVDGQGLHDYGNRGVATPEQVIRIKQRPLILPAPDTADLPAWHQAASAALAGYVAQYLDYFRRNNLRVGGGRRALDPIPRVLAIPGLGLAGVGRTALEASVSADVAQAWADAVLDAESVGGFESITEAEHFDMEYWSLEQAKLGRQPPKRLAGRIVVVTGGAGAIGSATARAFAAEGADVALLDLDEQAVQEIASPLGRAIGLRCDATDRADVAVAFGSVVARFGGVDIVVSNAGAATPGMIADLDDEVLRRAFDLNFFAHQNVAQAAIRVMRAQALGGTLLFNVSKQAINPGPDFGAYGTPKAALLALVRQYALEHGADAVRVNAVNPDRIRSGLLTSDMIRARSQARGLSEADYMGGNLLRQEVLAEDVARAFVVSALLDKTTGNIITVDGGNVAAMLR